MLKIFASPLELYKNKTHWAFNDMVSRAITLFGLAGGTYKQFIKCYLAAFATEDEVFQKFNRKAMTEDINEADKNRDIVFRQLRDSIRVAMLSFDPAIKRAAEMLNGIFSLYGGANIPNMGWNEESGAIGNIIDDFSTRYSSEVELLGLGGLLEQLRTRNDDFLQMLTDRATADSELGKKAMVDARNKTDEFYRAMIDVFNAALLCGDDELIPFANYLNVEINRYRQSIGYPVAGANRPNGDEGGETLKQVTLTFIKDDTSRIRISGFKGGTYEIPSASEGMVWLSTKGGQLAPNGIFPSKSLTFKEEALGERVKVEFHFLDGVVETLYGEAGTEMATPATSSKQTVWEPEPTGLFPAVFTQYVEAEKQPSEPGNQPGAGGTGSTTQKKVEWEYPDGHKEVQFYEVGQKIVPPEPPAGYIWNYHPNYMPDHDLTIDCLEDE